MLYKGQDLTALREELEADEDCVYELYADHLGNKTGGIGHLVTQQDPEFEEDVGTPVSEERVEEWFKQDVKQAINDCYSIFQGFASYPGPVQSVIINMAFNLGRTHRAKFQRMINNVIDRNYSGAADEMLDNKWAMQVPNRANKLAEIMRSA